MKDTKYKILAYFDNQSYRKLFNEVNSDYAENLQILLHNLSLFSYDVLIIGVILYTENISNIISAIRKITQIPIIILADASSLLCMSCLLYTFAIIVYLFVLDWRMALVSLITIPVGMMCYMGTVSYTHLDVYKRQPWH